MSVDAFRLCIQDSQAPEVLYAGVFLDQSACTELLAVALPKFSTASADHVTLRFQPTNDWLRQLPLGEEVVVTSSYQAVQDGIQVRRCTWFQPSTT